MDKIAQYVNEIDTVRLKLYNTKWMNQVAVRFALVCPRLRSVASGLEWAGLSYNHNKKMLCWLILIEKR